MKHCFFGFIIVAALISSNQARLILPKEQKDRLEVHCIEEYGKYCNGKLTGFKFNDGCRICKCDKESVLCKKGPCQFYTKMDQDALDYCDSILLQNKNSYKLYKQQQWRKSVGGKEQVKSSSHPQHSQSQKPVDRSMLGTVRQHGDEKLIRGPHMSHQSKIGIAGHSKGSLSSNLVGADDYRKAFAQPARLTNQNVGQIEHGKMGKLTKGITHINLLPIEHASNSVVPDIQASGLDSGELSPILHQENQPSKQPPSIPSPRKLHLDRNLLPRLPGQNMLMPDLGPLALKPRFSQGSHMGNMLPVVQVKGLPVSGIVQTNGKVVSPHMGSNIQPPGNVIAALSPAFPQKSRTFSKLPSIEKSIAFGGIPNSDMIKTNIKTAPGSMSPNIQPPSLGLVPPPPVFLQADKAPKLLPIKERGNPVKGTNFPGPHIQQNLLNKGMPPPVHQIVQPLMKPINPGLSNRFARSNRLPSSGILKSDGSIEQVSVKTPGVKKDAPPSPQTSNVGKSETRPDSIQKENILPQPLKQDSPQKIYSYVKPNSENIPSKSGRYPIIEFEDKNGQKYFHLPSKQFDELKHLAEGSPFSDHTRLDMIFHQKPQHFTGQHMHQPNSQPKWRPMDTFTNHPRQPSCHTAPINCYGNNGGMKQNSPMSFLGNSFYPSSSPMYYGPGPYIDPSPWMNRWRVPGGFPGGELLQSDFGPHISEQNMGPGISNAAALNMMNWPGISDTEKNIEMQEITKRKEEEMSEKAKSLLELTKSAIRVLIRAKRNELVTIAPSIATNSSSDDNATVTMIALTESNPDSASQEVKELTSIVDEMEEIVPKVENIVTKEDENQEIRKNEAGEQELLFKAANVIVMSPFDTSEFDSTQEYKGDEQDEIDELKLKLSNCEAYTERLLEAFGDGSQV